MKNLISLLCSLMLVLSMTGLAIATQSYQYEFIHNEWVDTSGNTPVYWVKMFFPASGTGTYTGGVFEYDNYISQVNLLKITLYGYGDNSSSLIQMFLDFNSNHSSYLNPNAGYNVDNDTSFTLTLDIKNNDLLYNGADVGNLSNVSLNSFLNTDEFYVGYACHFWVDKTVVEVSVNGGEVPEPASMILLGSGLLGLAGLRKKFKK